jgi:hypothetical protein
MLHGDVSRLKLWLTLVLGVAMQLLESEPCMLESYSKVPLGQGGS